jgi:hypothetical protein
MGVQGGRHRSAAGLRKAREPALVGLPRGNGPHRGFTPGIGKTAFGVQLTGTVSTTVSHIAHLIEIASCR